MIGARFGFGAGEVTLPNELDPLLRRGHLQSYSLFHEFALIMLRMTVSDLTPPSIVPQNFFCLGRTETHIGENGEVARSLFQKQRALLCRGGIDASLLALLNSFCARASFVPQQTEVGHRTIEAGPVTGSAVQLILNRAPFKKWLEAITGCAPLAGIEGRIVKTLPGGVDHLDWHRDTMPKIELGMTLHLVDCAYEGGGFELRKFKSKRETFRHEKPLAGDVVLFDIKPDLEHRVLPISHGDARLVFTGWFVTANEDK
jgi:2OG-Fe(II) oxygenase superfamily